MCKDELTYLERIRDNGLHLLGLLNNILDLSKVEAGKLEVELAATDLCALVQETLAQLEGQLHGKAVSLLAEIPAAVAPLETDRGKLKQILINLVTNALKFTAQGTTERCIY